MRHISYLLYVICFSIVNFFGIIDPVQSRHSANSGDDLPQMILQLTEGLDPGDFENETAIEEYIMELLESFPIDLNRATPDALRQIPGITAQIVTAINEHRQEQKFTSVDDLLLVYGIGPATLRRLRPWVTVEYQRRLPSRLANHVSVQQLFRLQYSLPVAEGYRSNSGERSHYTGSPARIYHRHSVTGERFSGNITQVKLPGEPLNHSLGFDFTSAHATIEKIGPLQRLVIGDYSLRFGQGLVLWSSPSFGKGGTAHTAPYRHGPGITPYRSSSQIRFLRGFASKIASPVPWLHRFQESKVIFSAFYSNRLRSAVETRGDTIRPPSSSPYHRTETELDRRYNTVEMIHGGNFVLTNTYGNLGFTFYDYQTDRPVLPAHSSPLQGQKNRVIGADILVQIGNFRVFGEYAVRRPTYSGSIASNDMADPVSHSDPASPVHTAATPGNRNAWIAGIMGGYSDTFDWVFSSRNYRSGYWSELGSGFGEGTGVPVNQSGWYFGFRIRPSSVVGISGYVDRFRFPRPRRGMTRPSEGWEPAIQLRYRYNSYLVFRVRIRYKERTAELERHDAYLRTYRVTDAESRFSGRFRVTWQFSPKLVWQSQIDLIQSGLQSELMQKGLALSQVIRWQTSRVLRFDMNMSVFDTDDFTSRIYLFEYDLTYAMSSSMLYGLGQRSYIVMRYQPSDWILLEAKAGRTRYFDRPAIGSGHDMTIGPSRTVLGMQIRLMY